MTPDILALSTRTEPSQETNFVVHHALLERKRVLVLGVCVCTVGSAVGLPDSQAVVSNSVQPPHLVS